MGCEKVSNALKLCPLSRNVDCGWRYAIPNVHFDDHDNDIKMRKHAFGKGADVYNAAGAVDIFETPHYPSTHNLGACRMNAKPRDGVCYKNGKSHGYS